MTCRAASARFARHDTASPAGRQRRRQAEADAEKHDGSAIESALNNSDSLPPRPARKDARETRMSAAARADPALALSRLTVPIPG